MLITKTKTKTDLFALTLIISIALLSWSFIRLAEPETYDVHIDTFATIAHLPSADGGDSGEVFTSGIASWYSYQLEGIRWSDDHRTAASRELPRYSYARVTNLDNGKSVIVFINDYGPEEDTGRQIDLSSYAFKQLAPLSKGLINVKIESYEDPI